METNIQKDKVLSILFLNVLLNMRGSASTHIILFFCCICVTGEIANTFFHINMMIRYVIYSRLR